VEINVYYLRTAVNSTGSVSMHRPCLFFLAGNKGGGMGA